MPQSDDPALLSPRQWEELQELASRYEKARRRGDGNLAEYLPAAEAPHRRAVLCELIKTDLEFGWRGGRRPTLEDYVERFPELRPASQLPASLVYEEFRVRQLYGDRPPLDSYRTRFPSQFLEVQRRAQADGTDRPSGGSPGPPPPPAPVPTPRVPGFFLFGPGTHLPIGPGYTLVRRLGRGSFAEVWEAEGGGFLHAVKIITSSLDCEDAQRELQALEPIRRLKHSYLLKTEAFYVVEDRLFIVMELADGTLRDRLKECQQAGFSGIPPVELLRYVRESAEALDYMHRHNVVHRDIKPQNLLLHGEHIKVGDLGLARIFQSDRLMASASRSGTPVYMAPEVWRSKVSARSDLYSLAVTYAELRLGQRPFSAADQHALMVEHMTAVPNLGNMPESEKVVLLRALSKDPALRQKTCGEFVTAVEEALIAEGVLESRRATGSGRSVGTQTPVLTPGDDPGTLGKANTPALDDTPRESAQPTRGPRTNAATQAQPRGVGWLKVVIVGLLIALVSLVTYRVYPIMVPNHFSLEQPEGVTMLAGKEGSVTVHVHCERVTGPVHIVVTSPAGVTIPDVSIEGDECAQIKILTSRHTPLYENEPVTLRATFGNHPPVEATFNLTVRPYYWQDDWSPVPGSEVITDSNSGGEGSSHYQAIDVTREGRRVRFVLVPRSKPTDPATYYIMQDKVSVELFRSCPDRGIVRPAQEDPPLWQKTAEKYNNDLFPVLGVRLDEALAFANWLGAKLPTLVQWDKAAGRFEEHPRIGPCSDLWWVLRAWAAPSLPPNLLPGPLFFHFPEIDSGVAVDREIPLPVGKAVLDVSPFGCRDMAGNGWEWTRELDTESNDPRRFAPLNQPAKGDLVWLRGVRYTKESALSFERLTPQLGRGYRLTKSYLDTSDDIGFRCVIETNP